MAKSIFGRKKSLIKVVILFSFLVIFFSIYEAVLRIKGAQPFQPNIHNAIYEPDFIFVPSPFLGYRLNPGKFKFIMCDLDSLSFNPVHNNDSLRITRPLALNENYEFKKKVFVFGSSFTYGVGVEDSLTFPYLLQKKYPEWNIINFGAPGYGPLQALLLLKRSIMLNDIPTYVIVNYSYYHDNTNTLSRKSRETIVRFSNISNKEFIAVSKFPYARIENEDKLQIKYLDFKSFYKEWPLRRHSALINLLETKYNEKDEHRYDSHMVSKRIIDEINELCLKYNITLIVAGINNADPTKEMLAYCDTLGILTIDISVDLSIGSKYRLHAKDGHPNALAHREYANKYIEFFKEQPIN